MGGKWRGAVCGVAGIAAIGCGEAVLVGGVAFDQVALRDAMEGEDELIEVAVFDRRRADSRSAPM